MQISRHYASLPERFSSALASRPFRNPQLVALNEPLATRLGLDTHWLRQKDGLAFLSQGQRPDGAPPVAMAYAGHQFGHFVPSLGDGRAMLVGELTDRQGKVWDLHLKGSGPTPFSRRGDGHAALGPVLREYLVSEAMAALDIPTTRALAALTTGENVVRETLMPGGVIARVASTHVRVGTFQFFAARQDREGLTILVDHVIERLYPELADSPNRALALLNALVNRQAQLIAQWMLVGFIHGVMNTDNMSIAGETIDFGPCAFLDNYDPGKVFSFIDQNGRYAYGQQPDMALWNLGRLAEALLLCIDADTDQAVNLATDTLSRFDSIFGEAYLSGWRRKLGLFLEGRTDTTLISRLLTMMHRDEADFTLTFRHLNTVARTDDATGFLAQLKDREAAISWLQSWKGRLDTEDQTTDARFALMQASNPRIIPRNHQIEAAIKATLTGDYTLFHQLAAALARPFEDADDGLDLPPASNEHVRNTFCGT
ncbi:protein adenylyltransferase SelO [Gluconobacter cerinus]|uniref:protein adenylyltransferase SelO n=1 Tax=Gluconobacter cerinus TaxID=38307 RepID=UPI001B8B1EBB|nr:YdiU family protein [Gluconobacter cerinus]MBS1036350.1 YdiU family protein [Gluconobacter cerinus]